MIRNRWRHYRFRKGLETLAREIQTPGTYAYTLARERFVIAIQLLPETIKRIKVSDMESRELLELMKTLVGMMDGLKLMQDIYAGGERWNQTKPTQLPPL